MRLFNVLWSKIGIVELTIIIATVGMIRPIDTCQTNTQSTNPASTTKPTNTSTTKPTTTSSVLSKKHL